LRKVAAIVRSFFFPVSAIRNPKSPEEYAFRFDVPLDPVIVGGEVDLEGWLLHREGKPIHGLRVIVQRRFFRREILRGRRKRKRPEVAAVFPQLADAEASGFLFELRLRFGRSHLTFQLMDHERVWRTFAIATVVAFPLALLSRFRLTHLRQFLISYLKQSFAGKRPVGEAVSFPSLKATAHLLTKRVDLFATAKSNLFIIEIGELVAAGFRELGCEAQLHLDAIPEENPPDETLQIVVTPHEYYNLFLTEKVSRKRARELTRNVHLLCTEQPATGWFESNLQWGSHSAGLADINPLGVAAHRARGMRAHQLQLGYHPILAHPVTRPHAERAFDITFLGSMTERRDEFFARHADFFAHRRCHLRLVPLGFAKTKETRSYLSVERRNELLSDSRILLNVHYSEQRYFEWHRMLVGLANGCCIITETCQGHGALVPGKHFIMVEPEYVIPCCEYYLAHPEECERIALAGQHFIETELRQAQNCRTYLQEIEAPGAAPLTIAQDAPAAPLPPALLRQISRRTRRLFREALGRDLRTLVVGEAVSFPRIETGEASSFPYSPPRAEVIRKREAYKARLTEQEERRAQGEPILRIHDNAALAACREPKLSVLITLYNYAHHIEECLASIASAAEKLPQPPEIVIVNDASTDKSLARALDCQQKSSLPIRIVDKEFNTGLADARNIGIETARAPYVFMMDADNLIFPEGLKQLLETIAEGDYAAAYSLLCRFRGTPENRVGLLSYYDWDPQILVQYPYIDAMAIFRRDVLLELGGYDNHLSQIGWFGWEDYDMWLRFAQHDYPVGFVPNTLCLYRHHDTSMINTTNLFEPELVHHFLAHYGDLLDRFEPRARVFGVDREKIAELASAASAAETPARRPVGQA
jgi:GT2 family glycosyltransferase